MAKIAVEHEFNYARNLVALSPPENCVITNFGTPGSTNYTYYITSVIETGITVLETLITEVQTSTGNATLNSTNFNRITWDKVWGATSYRIYNDSGLLALVNNLHYDDIGSSSTAALLPVENTTGYTPDYACQGTLFNNCVLETNFASPMQESTVFQCAFPSVISWSPHIDWVFLAEGTSAAATRRISLYDYNRTTSSFTWKGYVTLTFPPATNHTIRGFAMTYDIYSKGSVAVSGTAVTGTNTTWSTDRLAVGSRIGFGSTDPNQIGVWYEISAIGSNTGITLSTSAGTIAANSVYCIEDVKAVVATTNATTTNGGLFVAKGLRYENFASGGTTIPAATTTDNIRAVYWLADASTVTNTVSCGNAVDDRIDWQTQYTYVIDGTSTPKVFKYNIRAALTPSSGKSTAGLVLSTNTQSVTGTVSQNNNGELVTANHGPGAGFLSLYFVTATRVYRANTADIISENSNWIAGCSVEFPPLGVNTYPATSVLSYIEHLDFVDRFIIWTTGSTGQRSYVTKYQTDINPFDCIIGIESKQLDQTTHDADAKSHINIGSSPLVSWNEEGITYILRQNASSTLNQLYAIPQSACYIFDNIDGRQQYITTPAIPTPSGCRLYRAYINYKNVFGANGNEIPSEPIRVSYRINGIYDNSGSWKLLSDSGDLTGIKTGKDIQFKIEHKVNGAFMIPSQVRSVCVVYETDTDIPSHLQWNVGDTSATNGVVGFIQKTTYGSVPNLNISYYRTDTDELVLSQDSTGSSLGVFEYWNGSAWASGLDTDSIGKRRRFRPTTGILTGINVYCKLKTI
jgi:hypothetical protein